jgi:hypothetical protein
MPWLANSRRSRPSCPDKYRRNTTESDVASWLCKRVRRYFRKDGGEPASDTALPLRSGAGSISQPQGLNGRD